MGGGERIEPYETVRQHKCGGRICIALTVSPILNRKGEVIGASKIARDTSDQHRAEEQRSLLLREMDHRIKNLFAISASLVRLSAQHANSADTLAEDLLGRFSSLARAHSLTLDGEDLSNRKEINLHSLIREIVAPYHDKARAEENVTISGLNWTISASEVTSFALLFYEFVTNRRSTARCQNRMAGYMSNLFIVRGVLRATFHIACVRSTTFSLTRKPGILPAFFF